MTEWRQHINITTHTDIQPLPEVFHGSDAILSGLAGLPYDTESICINALSLTALLCGWQDRGFDTLSQRSREVALRGTRLICSEATVGVVARVWEVKRRMRAAGASEAEVHEAVSGNLKLMFDQALAMRAKALDG